MPKTWAPPRTFDGLDPDWSVPRLEALAYVVGVLNKGDGSVYSITRRKESSGGRRSSLLIELKASSREFVSKFDSCCASVLARGPNKIQTRKADGHFVVKFGTKEFVRWWRAESLRVLEPFLNRFSLSYLRGRYDSDGSPHNYGVDLCGAESSRDVLEFDRGLCARLGLRVGQVKPYNKPGAISFVGSKRVISREQKLRFSVNASDFLRVIGGFSVVSRDKNLKARIKGRKWTPWPPEVRSRAVELEKVNAWSSGRIAEELSKEFGRVPTSTVYFWLKRKTVTFGEYSAGR